ncbi:MAG: hypothetical protein QW304_07725 [Thermoproteota archaeon]
MLAELQVTPYRRRKIEELRRERWRVLFVTVTAVDAEKGRSAAFMIRDKARQMGLRALGPRPMKLREVSSGVLSRVFTFSPYEFRLVVFPGDVETNIRFIEWLADVATSPASREKLMVENISVRFGILGREII